MILYINGDSHAAAAEAANIYSWAQDDSRFFFLGTAPHPDNLAISWSRIVADALKMGLNNQSQSGSSNDRIIRLTRDYIASRPTAGQDHFLIISWSTWEREEWFDDGIWWQVGASGADSVPSIFADRYKKFVTEIDWPRATNDMHDKIWRLHQELDDLGIAHIFFNGDNDFGLIPKSQRKDWQGRFLGPYDPDQTYSGWLRNHGFKTVAPNSWHFGREAHAAWGHFLLQYIIDNHLI